MTNADILAEMLALFRRRASIDRRMARALRGRLASSPALDGMPHGSPHIPDAAEVAGEINALARERDEVEQDLAVFARRIAPAVNALPDGPHRTLLDLRYVERLGMGEVARRAGYALRHAVRLIRQGEKMLDA